MASRRGKLLSSFAYRAYVKKLVVVSASSKSDY